MKINLEEVKSISLDVSSFPKSVLEVIDIDNIPMVKREFSSHSKGEEVFKQINIEWTKVLKEKHNGT